MSSEKKKISLVSDLGEFEFIDRITEKINIKSPDVIKGVGDDAAVINNTKKTIVTTDILTEGVHFNLVYTPLKHLGYKAVVVNLSDIYAMNAIPGQIVVSIAFSGKFSVQAIEEIYDGIKTACEMYNVDLVGGDTSASFTGLTINITAIGQADKNSIVYRNKAQKNDLICVTGNLGAAYMGLQLLERENKIFKENPSMQPQLDGYDYILRRQLKPEARKDVIEKLAQHNILPTSMIDISDGLSSELFHICTQSSVGCTIYEEKIPIDQETATLSEEFHLSPITCALNGGEDYELLFTVPLSQHDAIAELKDISIIGHITDKNEGLQIVTEKGESISLSAQGWKSF